MHLGQVILFRDGDVQGWAHINPKLTQSCRDSAGPCKDLDELKAERDRPLNAQRLAAPSLFVNVVSTIWGWPSLLSRLSRV